jgi:DNA-binding XRE family transcriptional regulator
MLIKAELDLIRQYVDDKYFDREKLIKYLNMHSVVGNEIFSYCDKRAGRDGSASYSNWLEDEYGFKPLPVVDFVRRIPFYFYVDNFSDNRVGDLSCLISGVIRESRKDETILERLYQSLEYMFYEKKLPLIDIFCYITDQTHYVGKTEMFFQWKHYLQLCDDFKSNEYLPNCFIASYNEALEKKGLSPIIYEIGEIGVGEDYWRSGSHMEFEGVFPFDRNGQPIMKWIGLRVKNAKNITCSQDKSSRGKLSIEITPNTTIHVLNCCSNGEGNDDWYQIYAGPKMMEFDYKILKMNRKLLKYTQQDVADAIGATVRTYQKWENGETTPDGHFLLRLLNWLDIRDVQDVVRYTE